jgi:DNA repair protein RadD
MEGKEDCVILDYAENIKRHAPDGDIFNPDIKAVGHGSTGDPISAVCELCGAENQFPARPNDDGYGIDENGYFIDLDGQRIETGYGHLPAHHGRRCTGQVIAAGEAARCAYRWTYKKCHECGHPNDIAARYCEECKAEIVDPNEKLRLEFHRAKHDPYVPSTDEVRDWMVQPSISRAGNPTTRVTFITDFQEVTIWLSPESEAHRARHQVKAYNEATQNGTVMPSTITYCKDASNSKFWRLIAYNRPADEVPE